MNVLIRKAWADVIQRKARTGLISLSILISILGLTAVNSANETIGGAFIYSHDTGSSPDMTFLAAQAVAPSIIDKLRQLPNVARVQLRQEYHSHWHFLNKPGGSSIQINGYADLNQMDLGSFQLSSGRWPAPGELVVDSGASATQSIGIGDKIAVDTPQGTTTLLVVGLGRTRGLALTRGSAQVLGYMQSAALEQFGTVPTANTKGQAGPELNNAILVKVAEVQQVQTTFQTIEHFLEAAQLKIPDATFYNTADGQKAVQGMLLILEMLSLIGLLISSLLVINTIHTLITQQTRIVGIMKALGGTRWRIIRSYLLSILVYSLVGTFLGIPAGLLAGQQLANGLAASLHTDLGPGQIAPGVVVFSGLAGLLLPLLAALLPLWQGTRISIREALAAYGVKAAPNSHRLINSQWWWIPQTVWLGFRSTFRKPIRAGLTALALTLAGAVFVAVQLTTNSIDYTLTQQAEAFRYDLQAQWGSINYRPGIYQDIKHTIEALPTVDRVEPRASETIATPQGAIVVTGLQADTKIYQYQLLKGRWLTGQELNTVVISNLLSEALHLQPGDTLTLNAGPIQVHWQIVGIVHDLQAPDSIGVAYTSLENLNLNLLQRPADSTLKLMITSSDHSEETVYRLGERLTEALSKLGIQAEVATRQEIVSQIQSINLTIYILFYTIALIVALVGLLGLFDTISTTVLERRLEIGILRTLGAGGRRITFIFWVEGMVLCLIAFAIGTVLGVPCAYAIVRVLSTLLIPFDFSFSPLLIPATFGCMLVTTTIASIAPTAHVARLPLREILRYD